MRILVTGVSGQLGYDVNKELHRRNEHIVLAVDIDELDITNKEEVDLIVGGFRPDIIMHHAAYTAVDKAEDDFGNCYKVNIVGTEHLLDIARKLNSKFLYISTDYVFDGTKEGLYESDDTKNPQSVYGKSKDESEKIVINYNKSFIVRISWAFGLNGNNFVKTMLKLGKTKDKISVVNDQFGSPTYTADLAILLCDMIETEKYGVYHATNEGYCTWYDFANKIFEYSKININVIPCKSSMYPTKAKRPTNSRLSKESLDLKGFNRLPHWQDALKRYLKELEEIA
jgi:dTDP-4-dehydrorhamnose reductase